MFCFIDFQQWGVIQDFVAAEIKKEHKGYNATDDGIHIFLNFKKVAVVKSKAEAVNLLTRLIGECPKECRKDYEEHKEVLFRSLE